MAIPMLMRSHVRSYALAFFGLVAGVCIITPAASAKGPWAPALDLEPSLRSAALVLAVRVEDVSQMRVRHRRHISALPSSTKRPHLSSMAGLLNIR